MSVVRKNKYNQKPTEPQEAAPDQPKEARRNYVESTGFANYFTERQIQQQLKTGQILEGLLNVTPSGYKSGYVETKQGAVVLPETHNLNRAMHGDTVYVLLVEAQSTNTQLVNWQIDESKTAESAEYKRTRLVGSVVGVKQAKEAELVLECLPAMNQQKQGLLLQPMDRRFPAIEVHNSLTKQPQPNQVFNVKMGMWLQQMRLPAGEIVSQGRLIELKELDDICDFTLTSVGIPYNYPKNKELDASIIQLLEDAEKKLVQDCALPRSSVFELQQSVLDNIGATVKHLQTQSAVFDAQKRRSFVDKMVFTIDPDTAKDFDDSCHVDVLFGDQVLSFKQLADMSDVERAQKMMSHTGYEIGVHIADVTHYVSAESTMDQNAQLSTTSVYITDRCCPMYPYALADGLCSLNPAVPRYTYSVVFRLDKNGLLQKQKVWFGRGLIVSYARLDYVCAQAMIDKTLTAEDCQATTYFDRWPVAAGYSKAVVLCVQQMNEIALMLRRQREQNGALQLNNEEIRWRVNQQMEVSVVAPEQAALSHHLIEEFMVIANSLVAMRLVCSFPLAPILRQHPPPKAEFEYKDALGDLKLPSLDMASGFKLCKSLDKIAKEWNSQHKLQAGVFNFAQYSQAVINLFYMSNGLMRAKYVAGMSTTEALIAHWGIHSQLYMHFTSPIRRYADDMCHRMLSAALELEREIMSDTYRDSAEYAYLPHELVIHEVSSIYTYDQALPPMDFRKLCDKLYPVAEDNGKEMQSKVGAGAKKTDIVDQLSGKELNIDLKSQKTKQRLFKAIDQVIAAKEDEEPAIEDDFFEKQEINKSSLAYQVLQNCIDWLDEKMGTTVDMLRLQLTKCNALAQAAKDAEDLHHSMMLFYYIKNQGKIDAATRRPFIETKATMVSAKTGMLFVIPEFALTFKVDGEAETVSTTVFSLDMVPDLPMNHQTGEGVVEKQEFTLLKPFPVKLVCATEVIGGVEVWMAK